MGATAGSFASPGPTSGPFAGVNSGDDMRIDVTLTRKQWRDIKAVLGDMWSGPQDVLFDKLDALDLDGGAPRRRHEPDVFGCDFYR